MSLEAYIIRLMNWRHICCRKGAVSLVLPRHSRAKKVTGLEVLRSRTYRKDRPGDVECSLELTPQNNFMFDERLLWLYLPQKSLTEVVLTEEGGPD